MNNNNNSKNNPSLKNKTIINANVTKPKTSQKPDNKRYLLSSSNSELTSPKSLQNVSKKLFSTRNRFMLLKTTKPSDETIEKETQSIADRSLLITRYHAAYK